jgi:2-hydroxy-3-keto-5-methylthiopentenyl-1-phosphate phosphatase
MMKIAVQLDFDGTVTIHDISYLLLDTYADDSWRDILTEYTGGRITVGAFNRRIFAMVKADQQAMLDMIMSSEKLIVRPGLREFAELCSRRGYRTIIVSNGLRFYIEAILEKEGIYGVEVYASENEFSPDGIKVKYLGPDGLELETGFKETYTSMLLDESYYTICIGDGPSDIGPARIANKVFATGNLLKKCLEEGIQFTPFTDFFDIIKKLQTLQAG